MQSEITQKMIRNKTYQKFKNQKNPEKKLTSIETPIFNIYCVMHDSAHISFPNLHNYFKKDYVDDEIHSKDEYYQFDVNPFIEYINYLKSFKIINLIFHENAEYKTACTQQHDLCKLKDIADFTVNSLTDKCIGPLYAYKMHTNPGKCLTDDYGKTEVVI